MGFFTKALGLLSSLKSNKNQEGSNINTAVSMALSFSKIKVFLILIPVISILIVLLVITVSFAADVNQMQMVDSHIKDNVSAGTGIYTQEDLEEYYNLSEAAYETPNNPSVDLAGTKFKDIDGFNSYIKETVNKAGFGTRQGVVAAGVSLVGDYIKETGKRLRYQQIAPMQGIPYSRQASDVEGIITDNFYLDCSSFAWWALYNGGFNLPSYPQTMSIMNWAEGYGDTINNDITKGQAGDFLDSSSHIVLIIGTYDGGYYCAEESAWGVGAKISKRDFGNIGGSFVLLDMTKYYSDQNNVRSA